MLIGCQSHRSPFISTLPAPLPPAGNQFHGFLVYLSRVAFAKASRSGALFPLLCFAEGSTLRIAFCSPRPRPHPLNHTSWRPRPSTHSRSQPCGTPGYVQRRSPASLLGADVGAASNILHLPTTMNNHLHAYFGQVSRGGMALL